MHPDAAREAAAIRAHHLRERLASEHGWPLVLPPDGDDPAGLVALLEEVHQLERTAAAALRQRPASGSGGTRR